MNNKKMQLEVFSFFKFMPQTQNENFPDDRDNKKLEKAGGRRKKNYTSKQVKFPG